MIRSSTSFTLQAADIIANGAVNAVKNLKKPSPMTVTVLDSAGSIIVQKRMDDCPAGAYVKFSFSKARTCIHLKSSSRSFRTKYTSDPALPGKFTQAAAMVSVMGDELIPVAGGVLVMGNGEVLGAVGVSGAAADEDEYLAIMGVKALIDGGIADVDNNLMISTDPPNHCCKTLA